MNVLPIRTTQYNKQNPVFNAINQKYYEWGVKSIKRHNYVEFEMLYCFHLDINGKKISAQDGVDTLRSLRKLLKPQKDNTLNEFIGIFKSIAKEERIIGKKN